MMETINWDQIAEASTVAPPVKTYRFEMKNGTVIVAVGVDDYDIAEARADALAAEVERLKDENAELRAQLDAGEWWRPVDEPPSPGVDVEVIIRAEFKPNGNFRIVLPALKWRPAPPQE